MTGKSPPKGRAFTRKAFSPSVKHVQETLGSRDSVQRMEERGDPRSKLDDNLKQFIAQRISFYIGTASAAGEPYIQHRGGPPGFINIVDDQTLRIPDYPGNLQYITLENLVENPRCFIFMIDYETKTRVKFWGTASVQNLTGDDRQLIFNVEAWDINCSQHLPDFYSVQTLQIATRKFTERIAELEAELTALRKG